MKIEKNPLLWYEVQTIKYFFLYKTLICVELLWLWLYSTNSAIYHCYHYYSAILAILLLYFLMLYGLFIQSNCCSCKTGFYSHFYSFHKINDNPVDSYFFDSQQTRVIMKLMTTKYIIQWFHYSSHASNIMASWQIKALPSIWWLNKFVSGVMSCSLNVCGQLYSRSHLRMGSLSFHRYFSVHCG